MIKGVIRTRVGYAGGHKDHPDYHHMGDHTETVQVDFDPQRLTYAQLLDIFWQSHDPTKHWWSRQYMHAIFFQNETQERLAKESKAAVERKLGHHIQTEVAPLNSFTMAEDYHQKYLLKQYSDLKNEMSRIYPSHRAFVDSTAVSRLNGYVGGYGSMARLSQEIDRLGLSDAGTRALSEIVQRKSE